jgi:ornithine--oxo-acid transaminase
MSFIQKKWDEAFPQNFENHTKHVNTPMMQVLKIIGYDRHYTKALGMSLWDEQGHEFLDFLGGYSVFNLGHNPAGVVNALKEALGQNWPNMIQMDAPPLSGLLAKELCKRDPSGRLERVYFGNSGTEAIEAAIKFSRAATGRPRLLSFESGFHGLSMGALSLCGDEQWRERFGPFLPGCDVLPFGNLERLEAELSKKDVAALVIEPIQGEGGVRELPESTWKSIGELCQKYGTLLVLDEIQTGMGRTGKFFAFEHWGLKPDMVCLSKALTNGFVPACAVMGTAFVFDKVFDKLDRCVVHSSTFSENNLAMVAALAVLHELDSQGLVPRAHEMGEKLRAELRTAIGGYELVKEIRGRGQMTAIEFGAPSSMKLKMAWTLINKANKALFCQMITTSLMTKHRILTQVAGHQMNTLKLSPPLIIEDAHIHRFVHALKDVAEECHKFPGGVWDYGLGLAKRALTS